jgi:hypothetical protein
MMKSRFTVRLPGKGEVTLTDKNHLATGGEGAVYLKDGYAYKLYLDPAKARVQGVEDRIKLLAGLRHPYIVAPVDVLLDSKQEVVGHYMPMADGVPLVKTFTNAWRDQEGFGDPQAARLAENMRQAVIAAHGAQALIVDGNEMNWLAKGVDPRIIDVDSWQIGRFGATAVMPSIRDPHAVQFTEMTDWYAWAIVTFQVFTGIHPYKGSHPEFRKGDMAARMQANASVFDPRVKLNSAVRPFTAVPPHLLDWYTRVLQGGERTAPPDVLASQAQPGATRRARVQAVAGGGSVRHSRLLSLPGAILHVSGNGVAFFSHNGSIEAYDLLRKQGLPDLSSIQVQDLFRGQAALVRYSGGLMAISLTADGLVGHHVAVAKEPAVLQPQTVVFPLQTDRLVVSGNRVFAVNLAKNTLVELAISDMGARPALTVRTTWPVTPLSTRFFDGVWAMDSLGMPFLAVPEGTALHLARCPTLREYRAAAGFSRGPGFVLISAISRADGRTWRLQLKLVDNEFQLAESTVVEDTDLNVAVNERGIAVAILDDGEVTVVNTAGQGGKVVADSGVSRDQRLFALPSGMHYYSGSDVFGVSLS